MSERVGLAEVDVMALEMAPPVVVDADCRVGDVIREMQAGGTGCAIVTRQGAVAGLLTEHDVVHRVIRAGASPDSHVSSLMTEDPVVVSERDPIRTACMRMNEGGHRFVPVVEEETGRVVGCVRHKDVGRYLVARFADYLLNLPPEPSQRARRAEGA